MTPSETHDVLNRIETIFQRLRNEGQTALMPFITGGHPSLTITRQLLPAIEEAGASIVEIGFPFSDPIADGPVIASSMHEALEQGVTPRTIFDLVGETRGDHSLGLVAMVSESIMQRMGESKFIAQAAEAGFDGLIVPDLDLEKGSEMQAMTKASGMTLSLLVSQYTAPTRMEHIVNLCSGFVYLLARSGITGESDETPEIQAKIEQLRALTSLPLAVGFGISTPEHVNIVTSSADAAIVGSALVRRLAQATDPVSQARSFIKELAGGLANHQLEKP